MDELEKLEREMEIACLMASRLETPDARTEQQLRLQALVAEATALVLRNLEDSQWQQCR